jgi:uncharacterized membrane protein YcaP (DUF421 family)
MLPWNIILNSVVIYLFIVVAIRLFGKREISQLSIIDLVFILLISNSVQNSMVGQNTSLLGGIVAAGTLFIINRIFGLIVFKSKRATNLFEGNPLMLIYHGRTLEKHLARAEISHDELEQAVREHGVKEIQDVDLAVLEADGNISVLSHNFQHQTTHRRKAHKVVARDS